MDLLKVEEAGFFGRNADTPVFPVRKTAQGTEKESAVFKNAGIGKAGRQLAERRIPNGNPGGVCFGDRALQVKIEIFSLPKERGVSGVVRRRIIVVFECPGARFHRKIPNPSPSLEMNPKEEGMLRAGEPFRRRSGPRHGSVKGGFFEGTGNRPGRRQKNGFREAGLFGKRCRRGIVGQKNGTVPRVFEFRQKARPGQRFPFFPKLADQPVFFRGGGKVRPGGRFGGEGVFPFPEGTAEGNQVERGGEIPVEKNRFGGKGVEIRGLNP